MTNNFMEISVDQAIYIINNNKKENFSEEHLYWYRINDEKFIGIDNTSDSAWVEEFSSKELCFHWLNGDFEISELEDFKNNLYKQEKNERNDDSEETYIEKIKEELIKENIGEADINIITNFIKYVRSL